MRSLYESLLDDEEDLISDNTVIKQTVQNWINNHILKRKGRITFTKKMELSIKGVDTLEIEGPFPEWLTFAKDCNTHNVYFTECTKNDINKFLDNVTVSGGISIDATFPEKDLSIFNERYKGKRLELFEIRANYKFKNHNSRLEDITLDFDVDNFSCSCNDTNIRNLKKIDITNVKKTIYWSDFTFKDLKGFPKTIDRIFLGMAQNVNINSFDGLELVRDSFVYGSKGGTFYNLRPLYNMCNKDKGIDIAVGKKFTFNNFTVPLHLLSKSRKEDLEAWCVFMSMVKSPTHYMSLFIDYIEKYGAKIVRFDDMVQDKNYLLLATDPIHVMGIDNEYNEVWDTSYHSSQAASNGTYKSNLIIGYDNPFGPDKDLPRIERFKKEWGPTLAKDFIVYECNDKMKPLIKMDWRYKN